MIRRYSVSAAFLGGLLVAVPSIAQERNFLDNWTLGVGGFVIYAPLYEGSKDYQVFGAPYAFPAKRVEGPERSRLDFRGIDDVRFTLFRDRGFDMGPIIGFSFGRDEGLAGRLTGLGDVGMGPVVGAFAAYHFEPFYVDAAFRSQVYGLNGLGSEVTVGAGADVDVTKAFTLGAYASADYALGGYMDAYFSVTPAQAATAPAFSQFNADSGVKSLSIDLSAEYDVTEKFELNASAGYTRLVGDAASSPISETNNQFSLGAGFSYKF